MKIRIDDEYYIDEYGNKFYSETNKSNNNVIKNSTLNNNSSEGKKYHSEKYTGKFYGDEREIDKFEQYDIQGQEKNISGSNSDIVQNDLNVFSDTNNENDEYSYFGYNIDCKDTSKGVITVYSKLGAVDGVELKGAKINLYLLNGISPKLCESKETDADGKVIFDNLDNGCYRVIAIVDRRYFEKPSYISWNEVTIDSCSKEAKITVVNKIKGTCFKR